MFTRLVSFLNIITCGLFVGAMVGFSRAYNPKGYSVLIYLQQQQGAISALSKVTSSISLLAFILTAFSAFLERKNKMNLVILVIAGIFLLIAWLAIIFGIQPLNEVIVTWKSTTIPPNWTDMRDEWWFYHQLRALFSFVAFCLVVAVAVKKAK